jgi:hypothetical protein
MDQLRLGVIDATVLTAPHCFVAERAASRAWLVEGPPYLSLPSE